MESLSLSQARRLAVLSQRLAGPVGGLRDVLRSLRCLQLDPVNTVARSHLLVLWSRLGSFSREELDSLLWDERWLFEYWAHAASIVLTEDYALHRPMMDAAPAELRKRDWLAANSSFRSYVISLLRDSGPLPMEAIEDRCAVPWTSTGWTNGRNVEQMLDILWKQGVVTVARREGLRRFWSLAPVVPDDRASDPVSRAAELSLLALGVARERDIVRHFTVGRYPGLDLAACDFAVPAQVEGGPERWWVHRSVLPLLSREWTPRTTLLSPFDNLICDRDRTSRLWGFEYRSEMYVPKAKRVYGAYTMPILHGDLLIGRAAPRMDRKKRTLVVEGVYAEPSAPADAWPSIEVALSSLASFAGGDSVTVTGPMPAMWSYG
jgi:uncharacterized protein YcaQ